MKYFIHVKRDQSFHWSSKICPSILRVRNLLIKNIQPGNNHKYVYSTGYSYFLDGMTIDNRGDIYAPFPGLGEVGWSY